MLGLVDGDTDAGVLAAGQVVGLLDDLPTCEELVDRVLTEAAERVTAVALLKASGHRRQKQDHMRPVGIR